MKTLFIVDDEFGTVDALTAVLEDAGYRVESAANGRAALEAMSAQTPSLVLLDVFMPVLDGYETLRALQKSKSLAKVPVVMMSGIPESMVKRRCKGYAAFLRKPFSLDELLEVVKRHAR